MVTKPMQKAAVLERRTIKRDLGITFDWIATLGNIWFVGGLFLDGWAHNHGEVDQTFFTPWHAVFYSGFAVEALIVLGAILVNARLARKDENLLPVGYDLSLVGIAVFSVGGVGDLMWHTLFGIEADIEALLSPTHLILALGIGLIITGPLRAAWSRRTSEMQTWISRLPMLFSLASLFALFGFFTQYASPLVVLYPAGPQAQRNSDAEALGILGILVYSALLMGVLLLAMLRWGLFPGELTCLMVINAFALSFMGDQYEMIGLAAMAGVFSELLLLLLRPSPSAKREFRLFGFAVPLIFFTFYYLYLLATTGIGWSVHVWVGTIALAGMVGWLLSYAFVPPTISQEDGLVN